MGPAVDGEGDSADCQVDGYIDGQSVFDLCVELGFEPINHLSFDFIESVGMDWHDVNFVVDDSFDGVEGWQPAFLRSRVAVGIDPNEHTLRLAHIDHFAAIAQGINAGPQHLAHIDKSVQSHRTIPHLTHDHGTHSAPCQVARPRSLRSL